MLGYCLIIGGIILLLILLVIKKKNERMSVHMEPANYYPIDSYNREKFSNDIGIIFKQLKQQSNAGFMSPLLFNISNRPVIRTNETNNPKIINSSIKYLENILNTLGNKVYEFKFGTIKSIIKSDADNQIKIDAVLNLEINNKNAKQILNEDILFNLIIEKENSEMGSSFKVYLDDFTFANKTKPEFLSGVTEHSGVGIVESFEGQVDIDKILAEKKLENQRETGFYGSQPLQKFDINNKSTIASMPQPLDEEFENVKYNNVDINSPFIPQPVNGSSYGSYSQCDEPRTEDIMNIFQ